MRKWAAPFLWASVIFVTSCFYIPSKHFVRGIASAGVPHLTEEGFQSFWNEWWWLFVKGYHVFEYALLCFLLVRPLPKRRGVVMAALISFAFACSDEWHQTFVKGRGGKWTDVAIDCMGIAVVVLISAALSALSAQRSK